MHPAPSLIAFTVLSGLGLGMMAWLGLGLGGESAGAFGWIAVAAALVSTGVGGLASTSHLARPSRARLAFSQWRSSWLSREACLMVATVAVFLVYAGIWLFAGVRNDVLGVATAVLAMATVYATAMIYGQLRTVPRWSATPTRWLFVALSLASGLLGVAAAMGLAGGAMSIWLPSGGLLVAGAVAYWWQTVAGATTRGADGSTLATGTGLGGTGGRVELMAPPHTEANYLLTEMAYEVGRRRARPLRRLGMVFGFAVPVALVVISLAVGGGLYVLALVSHLAGIAALRWLFFAEAEHVQALYYGRS